MNRYNKTFTRRRFIRAILFTLAVVMLCIKCCIVATATNTVEDMATYPGVTISPDGTAWTTDYMDKTRESLPLKYTISTGQTSRLRDLQVGEHYYRAASEGSVHIGKWVVAWENAQCIHFFGAQNYKGFQTNEGICEKYYKPGWNAYCADCDEVVADLLFYAGSDTVKGILSMPAKSCYLYICPHCQGLEQGVDYQHLCKKISHNHYTIRYEKNAPADAEVNGYMAVTRHMYDNAAIYEGDSAKEIGYSDTKLRKNTYTADGYVFDGWNMVLDGSGEPLEDGQKVINLTTENDGVVVLYAQWKRVESTLRINPNGGSYDGKEGITTISKGYGETYALDIEKLIPPVGQLVTFNANGGDSIDSLRTKKSFDIWQKDADFVGDLKGNVYTYTAQNGHTDILTAIYQDEPFLLPLATKTGYALVGWYEDEACTEFVGRPGEEITTDCDMTLYAGWSQLVLEASDNYEAYDGSGAVDLSWSQSDKNETYYKLYQSRDKAEWSMIYDADTITNSVMNVNETINYHSVINRYVVPCVGYYTLSAYGAKGGDYENYPGGAGGYTTATYWLKKGDIITVYGGTAGNGTDGGVNGSIANGGFSKSPDGAGGGAATEIYITRNGITEPLMIAGGGGGANGSYAGGIGGESLTSISASSGGGSAFGGGGGGAQGGSTNGSRTVTTIDNPATEDIAFMSHLSRTFRDYSDHVIIGYMGENKAGYPIYPNQLYSDAPWFVETLETIGGLNRTIDITSTEYSGSEYHYNTSTNANAAIDHVPYYNCLQAGGGFARTYTATYPTNGNTNLVLSASQRTAWHAIKGYIEFIVTNADTGDVLHTKRIMEGYAEADVDYDADEEVSASGNHLYVGCWTDLPIPEGVENVTVTAKIYIFANDAHTYTSFTDTFFYGKEMVSVGQNTGGTSYINNGYGCKNQSFGAGCNHGAGYGTITGKIEAFWEETLLEAVKASDMAAPDKVVLNEESIKALDGNEVNVTWKEPEDRGTVYYHRCESYYAGAKQLDSNITKNTIVSGIKGYYYYLDSNNTGMVTISNEYVANTEHKGSVRVVLDENVQYLHIAAMDVAGNLGGTTDIRLCLDDGGTQYPADDSYPEQITLFTDQLEMEDTEFVYPADEKNWFIKADGMTEHILHIGASMDKVATMDFQINRLLLNAGDDSGREWIQTQIPHGNTTLNAEDFQNSELSMSMSGDLERLLKPGIAVAERTNHGVQVKLSQSFSVSRDVDVFHVYPQAVAVFKDKEYDSEDEQDISHGLTLIPDGEAPEIFGLEELQKWKVLDMAEGSKQIVLWAEDALSGLQEFRLVIQNKDNHMKAEFPADSKGRIEVEIRKDNPLFVGEIAISALAVDRVNNAMVVGEGGMTFTLETNLYKEREPEENTLKAGDGAILDIYTCGYVERIEVSFPEEFLEVEPDLNRVYEYGTPALRQKESLKFHIPVGTKAQEYEVFVKAYKNGQVLVNKPVFIVVKGTVLDELRTRIRNNG